MTKLVVAALGFFFLFSKARSGALWNAGKQQQSNPFNDMTRQIVTQAFMSNQFVPDIIPNEPTGLVEVVYSETKAVRLGNEFTPTEVREEPTMVSWSSAPGRLSTLVMLDGDITNIETGAKEMPYLHWLVYNIPGNDIDAGEIYAPYMGSLPPPGTGFHRYMFLIFPQEDEITGLAPLASDDLRPGFSMANWMDQYELGDAVVGNYYRATCDTYCQNFWVSYLASQSTTRRP